MTELRTGGAQGYLRIATEEAFVTPALIEAWLKLLDDANVDPGFKSLVGFYITHQADRPKWVFDRLKGLGAQRIADMDARGIDRQIIGLTAPGTNVIADADRACALVEDANDRLAQACADHPERFTGMAACAPQAPERAAREIERAVGRLGFRAVIVNSHILGEYLDNPKFAPVLEAIEALDVPLYIHPQTPPAAMIGPMLEAGLDGAVFGFGVETGLHALRLITSGTLDRFRRLQVMIGHMGEALPYWLYRLDFMHQAQVNSQRYECLKPLKKGKVSAYLRENFYVTNSGVAWEPAIRFAQQVLGRERVLYAMDYPYQCPAEEVQALDAMDMDAETKRMFFQTNAERVFKL